MTRPMSWIVVDLKTGNAVAELWSAQLAAKVNRERYEVLTALAYLCRFNKSLRGVR